MRAAVALNNVRRRVPSEAVGSLTHQNLVAFRFYPQDKSCRLPRQHDEVSESCRCSGGDHLIGWQASRRAPLTYPHDLQLSCHFNLLFPSLEARRRMGGRQRPWSSGVLCGGTTCGCTGSGPLFVFFSARRGFLAAIAQPLCGVSPIAQGRFRAV